MREASIHTNSQRAPRQDRSVELHVDIQEKRVKLGRVELAGQWVDFYALLALARTEPSAHLAYTNVDALARVGPWRHKRFESVGKEVVRHLRGLADLEDVIESEPRARMRVWRLTLDPECIDFRPDRESVRAWLEARSLGVLPEEGWLDDLRALVGATTTLQQGKAEETLAKLDELSSGVNQVVPGLEAWSALLRGKAASQYFDGDNDEPLMRLANDWSSRVDAPGKAVGAKLRALIAYRARFEDSAATLSSLLQLAAELERHGDISALGAVVNVMGLLARRTGSPEAGAVHHLRAAALFGIAGDYSSLQAALFNLAICRRELLARRDRPPDETVLALVELCRSLCACFGVGGDSAQAEIAGAGWAHEMGDVARARAYLDDAKRLLGTIDATYDQAFFREVRAQIELANPDGKSNPKQDLRAAEGLFEKIGDAVSAARVRRKLKLLRG